MTPQLVTLKQLPDLPAGWMYEASTRKAADDKAIETGQPFIYHFPGNGKYYVAKTDKAVES